MDGGIRVGLQYNFYGRGMGDGKGGTRIGLNIVSMERRNQDRFFSKANTERSKKVT